MPTNLPPRKKPDFIKVALETCWRRRDTVFYCALPVMAGAIRGTLWHGPDAVLVIGVMAVVVPRELARGIGWWYTRQPTNFYYGSISCVGSIVAGVTGIVAMVPECVKTNSWDLLLSETGIAGMATAVAAGLVVVCRLTPQKIFSTYKNVLFDYDAKNPPGDNSGGGGGGRRLRELLEKFGPKPAPA